MRADLNQLEDGVQAVFQRQPYGVGLRFCALSERFCTGHATEGRRKTWTINQAD